MKKILLSLLILILAAPAYAAHGRVLYVVCDKSGAAVGTIAYQVNRLIYRTQAIQGWSYDVCIASDSNFVNSLYETNPIATSPDTTVDGYGKRYGWYDMAVMLNMPLTAGLDTDAECLTYKVPHFSQWIDRNSPRAFPIPLFIPFPEAMRITSDWAEAYTGVDSAIAYSGGNIGQPYKDANGDSLYLFSDNSVTEAVVFNSDSLSWCVPLFWRDVQGRIAEKKRVAHCWMTVGSGNHRIIWLPWANNDTNFCMIPIVFAMFTKVQPIEIPFIAYGGRTAIGDTYSGSDTLQFGEGFKRVKDYAVANGMKIELAYYPYYMYSDGVAANGSTAAAYATAHPDNIRLTINAGLSWHAPSAYVNMIGSAAGTATSYDIKVDRITATQDSCDTYYPGVFNTSRLFVDNAVFANGTTNDKSDSTLMAIADCGITDVEYWDYPAYSVMHPANPAFHLLGPHRTWVHDNELRFHPTASLARYLLQGTNSADSLKKSYMSCGAAASGASYRRAVFMTKYLPYSFGIYVYIDGGMSYKITAAAAKGNRAMVRSRYAAGIMLPALTYSGGSDDIGIGVVQKAAVDSTRSLFLDVMTMMNNQKKMGDYLVETYGINGSTPFIWSWLSDVKWDRKNGNAFPNANVRHE